MKSSKKTMLVAAVVLLLAAALFVGAAGADGTEYTGDVKLYVYNDSGNWTLQTRTVEEVKTIYGSSTAYAISSAADLEAITANDTGIYILTNDIAFTEARTAAVISTFKGILIGNGHTISNLVISATGEATDKYGLVGDLWGTLNNVTLSNAKIESNKNGAKIGGLAGITEGSGSIIGCRVLYSDIAGTQAVVGGFIGKAWDSTKIENSSVENCSISVIIAGQEGVGGLVGSVTPYFGETTVKNCSVNSCSIISGTTFAGGLFGNENSATATNCHVENCIVAAAGGTAGGLIGVATGGKFEQCTAEKCTVVGYGDGWSSSQVGGLVGASSDSPVTLTGCVVKDCAVAGGYPKSNSDFKFTKKVVGQGWLLYLCNPTSYLTDPDTWYLYTLDNKAGPLTDPQTGKMMQASGCVSIEGIGGVVLDVSIPNDDDEASIKNVCKICINSTSEPIRMILPPGGTQNDDAVRLVTFFKNPEKEYNSYDKSTSTKYTELGPYGQPGGFGYGSIPAPVAKIGTTEYATLAEAIAAAKSGDTIELLKNITLTETQAISGKSITLDLAGNTLTGPASAAVFTVAADGGLTVKNTQSTGSLVSAYTAGAAVTVEPSGQFILNGITPFESSVVNSAGTSNYYVTLTPNQVYGATAGSTINLLKDIECNDAGGTPFSILNDNITLDGNGHKLTIIDTAISEKGVIGVKAHNATIQNLTLDAGGVIDQNVTSGNDNHVHAINIIGQDGKTGENVVSAKIENVTVTNASAAGVCINGRSGPVVVNAINLDTSKNAWGGVNYDTEKDAGAGSSFTFDADCSFGEDWKVWVEGNLDAAITVPAGWYPLFAENGGKKTYYDAAGIEQIIANDTYNPNAASRHVSFKVNGSDKRWILKSGDAYKSTDYVIELYTGKYRDKQGVTGDSYKHIDYTENSLPITMATASAEGYIYGQTKPTPTLNPTDVGVAYTFFYSTSAVDENGSAWNDGKTLDAGTYYVYAADSAGNQSKRSAFKVTQATQDAPAFTVDASANVTITGYDANKTYLYKITETASNANVEWKRAPGQSFTLTGLKAGAPYSLTMKIAESRNYAEAESSPQNFTTPGYYTVNYYANGGVGSIASQTAQKNTSITVKSPDGISRVGYRFDTWKESDGTSHAPGSPVDNGMDLYAQWTPKPYTIIFDAKGGSVTSQPSMPLNYNTEVTLPVAEKTDFAFSGWAVTDGSPAVYTGNQKVQGLVESGTITLYAVWVATPHNITANIINAPTDKILVRLMRGNAEIAQTEITPSANTSCEFENLPSGNYNLVAEAKDGVNVIKTVTSAVILDDDKTVNITFPAANVDSKVTVSEKENTPAVVVGNLDKEAEAKAEGGTKVTVTLTVEAKAETTQEDITTPEEAVVQDSILAIKTSAPKEVSENPMMFLEISVEKETQQGTVAPVKEPIRETSNIIELIVPYDFTGKENTKVFVYRVHDGKYEPLKNNSSGKEGTYQAKKSEGLIYIYSQMFSTYSIGYSTESSNPSSGGSSSQGSSTWLTEPTAQPTAQPTAEPTAEPTPSVQPSAVKTPSPATPAPFIGILAGLGAAAAVFGLRRK